MIIRRTGKVDNYGRMIKYNSANDAGLVKLNYWGNGSDGDLNTTGNVTLSNAQDGDVIVKNYRHLTVNAGHVLTLENRGRGLVIFVDGDLVISGTITMTDKGCKANPADSTTSSNTPVAPGDGNPVGSDGIRFPFKTDADTDTLSLANFEGCGNALYALRDKFPSLNGNGKIITIHRTGGAGGAGVSAGYPPVNGNTGGTGLGKSGGGGSGGARDSCTSRDGGYGTCFSGGAGSSGGTRSLSDLTIPSNYGGKGGENTVNTSWDGAGGAGNPGGSGLDHCYAGDDGTGGLLVILCSGNITINSGGKIESNGSNGGGTDLSGSNDYGGGGSGGGNIVLAYAGIYTNNGTVQAAGGSGGNAKYADGGSGGAGSVQILKALY